MRILYSKILGIRLRIYTITYLIYIVLYLLTKSDLMKKLKPRTPRYIPIIIRDNRNRKKKSMSIILVITSIATKTR